MKKLSTIIALLAAAIAANAQDVFYNNGSILQVNTGCIIQVNGNLTNKAASTFTNNGTVTVTGNSTNDQVMAAANTGTLEFTGTTAQTLNGTATYFAKNILVNNAAGITLNSPLKCDGLATFTNGDMVTTITNPIVFTSNGTVSGASDASHVNGYVVKEGTGVFTYPVGDGTKYQQCAVNLSANGTGMQVKYNITDAGAGTFTTGGTEATALIAYNSLEHWDITPLSTATGTVTMFWDGYKNAGILNTSDLKVAHKVGANWLNEGTTGTGTVGAGSVTSNSISSWSPFTLGSVANSTLPLRWLNINGNLNAQNQALINWQVLENNVVNYQLEKSTDSRSFGSIAIIQSSGNGTNHYTFTDAQQINNAAYYRVKQIGADGRNSYSTIIKLSNYQIGALSIYPNPVKVVLTLSVDNTFLNTNAVIVNTTGKTVQQIKIAQLQTQINIDALPSGIYWLKAIKGATQKIIKE
jgi:hypothetical protein